MGEPRLSTERVRALRAGATRGTWSRPFGDGAISADGESSLLGLDEDGMAIVWDQGDAELMVSAPDLADDLLDARAELARQRAEISSLRASLGEANGSEPVGCPAPGMCGCVASKASKG